MMGFHCFWLFLGVETSHYRQANSSWYPGLVGSAKSFWSGSNWRLSSLYPGNSLYSIATLSSSLYPVQCVNKSYRIHHTKNIESVMTIPWYSSRFCSIIKSLPICRMLWSIRRGFDSRPSYTRLLSKYITPYLTPFRSL